MQIKSISVFDTVVKFIMLLIGSALAALALEGFLIPDGIIDGGVVGISIMLGHILKLPTSIFLILINIPFLWFGYKHGGKKFVINCVFAISVFSVLTHFFEDMRPFTDDVFLATVFGGIVLGIGVGIIVRFGGSLDGTEMLAIILSKNTAFSVGQVVLVCNVFIFAISGFIFGWDKAMYSLITYFIVFKIIDMVVDGINESKAAMIISGEYEQIADAIMNELGRSITYIAAETGYKGKEVKMVYVVLTLMEISKLREIVKSVDKKSFMTISNVSDVVGKYKKYEQSPGEIQ